MPDVKIITGILCGYCDAAKKLLQDHGQDYEEVDVFEASALMEEYNLKTVPQIFIDDKAINDSWYFQPHDPLLASHLEAIKDTFDHEFNKNK